MQKMKKIYTILVLVGVLMFALIVPAGAAGDVTPSPTVSISYNIDTYVSGLTMANDTTYYILATDASYAGSLTTTKPGSAFWKIAVNGSGVKSVEGLYPAPGDLVSISGAAALTFDGDMYGKVTNHEIKFASLGEGGLGVPTMTYTTGNTALRYNGTYYVYSQDGWDVAEAKVSTLYYESFSEAVAAANAGSSLDVILLKSVTLSSTVYPSINVSSHVDIYCCNSSAITVADGGTLSLLGSVFDSVGTHTTIYLTDGGTINDSDSNTIYATLTGDDASVSGTNTTLTAAQAGVDTEYVVNIRGSFAQLTGDYFALTLETTINNTGAGGAYITGSGYRLNVNGGEVHTLVGFDEGHQIYITGGDLYVDINPIHETYITGLSPYGGDVYVSSGTAKVYGEITDLYVSGKTDYQTGGNAMLYGTITNATVTGASTLTLTSETSLIKAVVTDHLVGITGVAYNSMGTDYFGILNISSAVYNSSSVYATGDFAQISGDVWMSGDLMIQDASSTGNVSCYGDTYYLEIMGGGDNTAIDTQLVGTFGYVTIRNVDMKIKNGVSIVSELNVYDADVSIANGVFLGEQADVANCVINDGVLSFNNSYVYAKFTGTGTNGTAELHIAADCDIKSIAGVQGEFQSITGHVHTCGDLTLNGTLDNGTFGDNKAIITGGMTFYGDDGMESYLILTDAASSTNVELAGGKNISGTLVSAGFRYIQVNDETDNETIVSLTMRDYSGTTYPVNIGEAYTILGTEGRHGDIGLYVSGDDTSGTATVITLDTNNIYGYENGVWLDGVNATLTGYNDATITGESTDGGYLYDANLSLSNYAITGGVIGVDINEGSDATLTNITATGKNTTGGFGICIGNPGDESASSVTLDTAMVTGYTGIEVNCGSSLDLINSIVITGVSKGISVIDGSVSNLSDRAVETAALTRTVSVTGTGTNGDAMFIEKGSADLNGYTFTATVTGGYGVATGNGDVTVTLSDENNHGSAGAYIWGFDTGVLVGSNTVMTVSDYNIYGANSMSGQEFVSSGIAAAKVYGTLQLSGENKLIGGQYGIYSDGGTVTNFKNGTSWTTDETAGSAQGSGDILAGVVTSGTAIRAEGGNVTLGNYNLISMGINNVNSCGLYATEDAIVYLSGNSGEPAYYAVTGGTGYGVLVDDANVTIYNMAVNTTLAYSAQVDSGVLNLGTGVTLGTSESVKGTSAAYAELHVIDGNTAISAEGSFKNLTGYVTTTNDLTVTGTSNTNAYNMTDYSASATILGGGAHDLILGTDKVTATLEKDGTFASIKVDGTSTIQQDITVAGNLTVSNSDMAYALSATYADLTFAAVDGPYIRSFTASQAGAYGVTAGDGAKLYLTDEVNITGVACGLSLSGSAVVTDMQLEGAWLTAYSTAGTPLSNGQITATNGIGVNVSDNAVLLLGGHGITGTTCALNMVGSSAPSGVYLVAGSGTGENALAATAGGTTIVNINTAGQVTLVGYNAAVASGYTSAVLVTNGTVTLDDGYYSGSTICQAIVIAANSSGAPNVTLKNGVQVLSGVDGDGLACVTVTGYDESHKANLTIQDADILTAAQNGVLIGQYAVVSMADGSITGETLTESQAVYGVNLTAASSVFSMSGGTIGFMDESATDSVAIYSNNGGSVTVSGGTVGLYNSSVYSQTGIVSNGALTISGGSIYGYADAVDQIAGTTGISGGTLAGDVYALNQITGAATISGGTLSGDSLALNQQAGNTWISGGVLDTDENTVLTDTVILAKGNLWITGNTVNMNGIVAGDSAYLYIQPAAGPTVFVDGDFISMTGRANITGSGALAIGDTTDVANNVLNTGLYANGTDVPYNKLVLTGEDETIKTVTITSGEADIGGTFGVLTIGDVEGSDPMTLTVADDAIIASASTFGSNSTLIVAIDNTLIVNTVLVPGTLSTSGAVTVYGEIVGTVNGSGAKQLSVANASVSGTNVNIEGTFGEITTSRLDIDSNLTPNTVTLVGNVTFAGTGDGVVYVIGGSGIDDDCDLVDTTTYGSDDAASVYVTGYFASLKSSVILVGDTSIDGNETAVVAVIEGDPLYDLTVGGGAAVTVNDGAFDVLSFGGTSAMAVGTVSCTSLTASGSADVTADAVTCTSTTDGITASESAEVTLDNATCVSLTAGDSATVLLNDGTYPLLTVNGTASVTVNDGKYTSMTVNGGTLTIVPTLTVKDVLVVNGCLIIGDSGKLYTETIPVGPEGQRAILEGNRTFYFKGTLEVVSGVIKQFPEAVSNENYLGWTVAGRNDIISSSDYTIVDGQYLVVKWFYPAVSLGGGSSSTGYTVVVVKELDGENDMSGQLGDVTAPSNSTSAGSSVTVTVTAKTSFRVGTVTVIDKNANSLDVTDNGDGTYTFQMPSSDVNVSVDYISIFGEEQTTPSVEYAVESPQGIYFNGEPVIMMAYNVNGNNYFKLRDIAYLINGTGSQFSVDFSDSGLVTLATGQSYVPVGGENALTEDQSQSTVVSSWSIEVNGVVRYLKCYNIADNNYFQLRELAELLGFGVSYDGATNSVYITAE